ncbi:hypothetical protein BC826DRAFT_1039379 [Russula brevipes]|nr:hypothetical protein BC826DRAFT_1039379 [Russula brevipes]
MSWNGAPAAVLAMAQVPAPAPAGRGRSHPPSSMCSSAGASPLALDDRTVRPSQGGKRRLSVAVPGWE